MSGEIKFTEDQIHAFEMLLLKNSHFLFFELVKTGGNYNYNRHYKIYRAYESDGLRVENVSCYVITALKLRRVDSGCAVIQGHADDILEALNRMLKVYLDRITIQGERPPPFISQRL